MLRNKVAQTVVMALVVLAATALTAQADPHPGQSQNVAIVDGVGVINGGSFPTTTSGPTGAFTDFTFTNVPAATVSAATLAAYDTVLLNVASSGMACNVNTLSAAQKTDVVNFLQGGGKLIIYDSECPPQDYSWLPHPFTTSNPGALGGTGTVNIVEDNFLGTDEASDPAHFIDESILGSQTDAVGDMNILTTQDPAICLHMSGTNAANQTGPTHVYYPSGSGLLIYNGFDVDFMFTGSVPDSSTPDGNIAKIWLQELQQPRDGSGLLCRITVVGIALTPRTATNTVGTSHTVTARITDQTGAPKPNNLVTFQVTGANAGASGTCSPASCETDANGEVTFTYTGTTQGQDQITACFTPQGGSQICSAPADKEWTRPPNADPDCSGVAPSPKILWPPNHKYRLVTLSGATDPDNDPLTFGNITVTQDEPLNGTGDGDTSPDAKKGPASNEVYVRAERKGNGNGRVYVISFTVSDGKGGSCSGNVTVGVPHDQGRGKTPVDSGQTVNSFGS